MKGRATEEKIKRKLKEFTGAPIQTFVADVLSVDQELFTCELDPPDDAKLINVRLKASVDEDIKSGLVEIPKVGSSVLAGIIGNDQDTCFVIKVSEVDKILGFVGDHKFEMSTTGFVFNGGELGGLIKIEQLMSYFSQIHQFLAAIKNVVDVATYPTAAAGAPDVFHQALKTLLTPIDTPNVTRAQIEDTKIKH